MNPSIKNDPLPDKQARKKTKKHMLGQFMTTSEVAREMCLKFVTPTKDWVVFDPTCGDGMLLEAAALHLIRDGIQPDKIRLIGFDIDADMVRLAKAKLTANQTLKSKNIEIHLCDALKILEGDLFTPELNKLLKKVNIVLGNPPYGKGIEVKFFEACNNFFQNQAELVFLMPIAFVDSIKGVKYDLLKGRPLGVTTGHAIVHHQCGKPFVKKSQKQDLTTIAGFLVLTGIKLYAKGEGTPTQTSETLKTKPYSSSQPKKGWLPCLRTGDVTKFGYSIGRLWVKYGPHLAHPKEIERFTGPRIILRRVPIWSDKTLGATYIEEDALCAGDMLIIKHVTNDKEALTSLCNFLNSKEAAKFIIEERPSVGFRDSFPKVSAKDIVNLLSAKLSSTKDLKKMS